MANSNYEGFGSGLVPVGCGFSLQNRGANFSTLPSHPNRVGPRKRPYHTILPAMLTRGGELLATLSNMGGFMQPQGHVQLIMNLLAFGMEPQEIDTFEGGSWRAAIDAPRFCICGLSNSSDSSGEVCLEEGIEPSVAEELRSMGHNVRLHREPIGAQLQAAVQRWNARCCMTGELAPRPTPKKWSVEMRLPWLHGRMLNFRGGACELLRVGGPAVET
ncbi:MAG: hypothetical protein SGPRY_012455 [Prymnesium sp.]